MIVKLLSKIRKDKKITKMEICKKAGIDMGYMTHIEKGERNPSGNVVINCRYCAMLDEERNIFKDLWENRFYKTEHHEPTFSYFLRTT